MARRTFTVIDVVEILTHWYAGRPKVEVAQSVRIEVGALIHRRLGATVSTGVIVDVPRLWPWGAGGRWDADMRIVSAPEAPARR
jgi:predicted ThiF/HesA family dinucleotide-utilizing enzyme